MIKRILLTFLQFAVFCGLFYVGGYWAEVRLGFALRAMQKHAAPPPMIPLWRMHVNASLDYVLNGLVFALALLVLVLLVQAIRKRLRPGAGFTVLAFVLAFLLSLALHSGFVPLSNP